MQKKDDEYFMSLAEEVANNSKEIGTHVGCVVVNKDGEIVSKGFNYYIVGNDSPYMSYLKPTRYLLSVHAEMNALVHTEQPFKDCTVYVTHASCDNCFKHLVACGVKEVIYKHASTKGKFIDEEKRDAIIRMMKASGVIHRNINGTSFEDDIL